MNKFASNLWVQCSERLPDIEDDCVLVLFPNGSIETVHIEDYFKDITCGVLNGEQRYTKWYIHKGVEYWHPLPKFDGEVI